MRPKCNPHRVEGDNAFLTLTNRRREIVGEAIVDLEDLHRVLAAGYWRPSMSRKDGSIYVRGNSDSLMLHRFVMDIDANSDLMVDHQNHNTLDCRKSNLNPCTNQENSCNRAGADRDSRSGVRNVHWHAFSGRWRVTVRVRGKSHHLGYFDSIEEAARVAESGRTRLFELAAY